LSGTTLVSWYQKGKTNLDFTEARHSEWQWHQLGVCTSLQTDNHAITAQFFRGRMPFLPHNRVKALKKEKYSEEKYSEVENYMLRITTQGVYNLMVQSLCT